MAERGEGFFAALSKRRLRRDAFGVVVHLQAAINRYLADHNTDAKPFRWKADPDKSSQPHAEGTRRWIQSTSTAQKDWS